MLIFFLHGVLQIRTFREQMGGVFIAVGSPAGLSQSSRRSRLTYKLNSCTSRLKRSGSTQRLGFIKLAQSATPEHPSVIGSSLPRAPCIPMGCSGQVLSAQFQVPTRYQPRTRAGWCLPSPVKLFSALQPITGHPTVATGRLRA